MATGHRNTTSTVKINVLMFNLCYSVFFGRLEGVFRMKRSRFTSKYFLVCHFVVHDAARMSDYVSCCHFTLLNINSHRGEKAGRKESLKY